MANTTRLAELQEFLKEISSGKIAPSNKGEVARRLSLCWHELEGGNQENMEGSKISNRMESAEWQPPLLSFEIERHGRQTGGSTRADVHRWTVNIDKGTASLEHAGTRYIGGMDKSLDVKPLAVELAEMLLNQKNDSRLKWKSDSQVKVVMRAFIPRTNWRTTRGREKRFRKAVESIVAPHGWRWVDEPYRRDHLEKNTN